jgi:hypothetical protein
VRPNDQKFFPASSRFLNKASIRRTREKESERERERERERKREREKWEEVQLIKAEEEAQRPNRRIKGCQIICLKYNSYILCRKHIIIDTEPCLPARDGH